MISNLKKNTSKAKSPLHDHFFSARYFQGKFGFQIYGVGCIDNVAFLKCFFFFCYKKKKEEIILPFELIFELKHNNIYIFFYNERLY